MPQDPQSESTSAEQLFKRLRETSEEDLPEVPDITRIVGGPEAGFGLRDQDQEQRRILEEQQREKQQQSEPAAEEGPQTQLEVLQEILGELRLIQDSIDALAGGA